MYWIHKLRPASIIAALGPAMVVLALLLAIWIYVGREAAYTFFGIVFLVFGGLSLANLALTKNVGYLLVALFQISGAFAFGGRYSELFYISHRFTQLATLFLIFFLSATLYLWITKRLKWRIRELLELAAEPVNEITNGFTPRPRPMGKADYTKSELAEFGNFALRNHIAIPYYEPDRVAFVAADWTQGFLRLYKFRRSYADATWVAFDFGGNLTVNISQRDYLNYRDSLSFDQLCRSLGNLFTEFLDLYRKGEGIRIIDLMNAVSEHPAS